MIRFSANLSMLYTELPFLDRFGAAAADGFEGVEYLGPYEVPAEAIRERLETYKLTQVLFNVPSGDWAGGERGIGALPGRSDEFRRGVGEALRYAEVLDCRMVNCLAGVPTGTDACCSLWSLFPPWRSHGRPGANRPGCAEPPPEGGSTPRTRHRRHGPYAATAI
jgi:hydroxypyruvate isomerase